MKNLKSIILGIILSTVFAVQAFASDHEMWAGDIENRNPTYSVAHVTNGIVTVVTATVTIGGAYLNKSSPHGSIFSAYKDLAEKLNGGIKLIPRITSTQRDALTSVEKSTLIDNITIGHLEIYDGTTWRSSAEESNEIGITASTTQTQAGGTALTMEMNFIETVASANNAVTLESVSNGAQQTIINDGTNILQIFPALDDDLGNGVNIPTHLDEHEEIAFWGKDSTTWHIRYTSESFHASMYEQDNSTEFVIHAVNEVHCYHSAGFIAGDVGSWIFNAGSAGASVTITAVADNSGGTILVTTNVAHGITVDDVLCQTGLSDANYVGIFTVLTVPTTTTYTITATWTATGTGFVDRPAYLTVKDIATGFYNLEWASTMQIAGSGVTLAFDLHDGMTTIPGSKAGYKFASTATIKQPNGLGEKIFSSGGRVFFTITNKTNSTNITPKHLKVRLEHI